jgi:hypothetical protein
MKRLFHKGLGLSYKQRTLVYAVPDPEKLSLHRYSYSLQLAALLRHRHVLFLDEAGFDFSNRDRWAWIPRGEDVPLKKDP